MNSADAPPDTAPVLPPVLPPVIRPFIPLFIPPVTRVAPAELALPVSVFVVAACGLVYELAAGAPASYLAHQAAGGAHRRAHAGLALRGP